MKIGIVTIHRSKNYGAELQTYAMQSFLEQQGFEAYVVDYWPEYREETEKLVSFKLLKGSTWRKSMKLLLQAPLIFHRFHKRWESTRRFIYKYLNLSQSHEYDVVIYGSDQIWRKMNYPLYKGYDPVYFASDYIISNKKISYAASMGKVSFMNEQDESRFLNMLNSFDSLSVREIDLKDYLDSKIGRDVPIVCDPVFLLDENRWRSFVDKNLIPDKPYIFYYNHQEMSITTDFANYLRNKTGMPIIEMRGQVSPFHYGKRYRLTADAREFLSFLSGASIVVTSSFHGVALSICMNRQFYYYSRSSRSNRIESLLQGLGLEERKIEKDFEKCYQLKSIDYREVSKKKTEIVDNSRKWLLKQLDIKDE